MKHGLNAESVREGRSGKRRKPRTGSVLAFMLLAVSAALSADVVTDWNTAALEYIKTNRISNQFGNRTLAMLHVAMFDAANGVLRSHEFFLNRKVAGRALPPEIAASAAAFNVLKSLYPGDAHLFEGLYLEHLSRYHKKEYRAAAVRYGEDTARTVLKWRTNDGSAEAAGVPFPDGTEPGAWRRTSPMMVPMFPGWGRVKPFAIRSFDQFRLFGPPALGSYEYARDYNEVKTMGARDSTIRTPDQTAAARFWPSGIPHIWNLVAHTVSQEKGCSLIENARLFALLNLALADANIVGWDMKYGYGFWRPVTAIAEGDYDGNDGTAGVPGWMSLLPAPAFPEYVSGHSTSCAAAATVLAAFSGSDAFTFTISSEADPSLTPRTYGSFQAAAKEAGISRVYGGIHFNFSNVEGLETGRAIGRYVSERCMLPR